MSIILEQSLLLDLNKEKNNDVTLQRSLSKYLTLSRFIELFFGYKLKQICLDLSKKTTK